MKLIIACYKQHKNGFNIGKRKECVWHSLSQFFKAKVWLTGFYQSKSPLLLHFLLMASFLEQGMPLVSSLSSTAAKLTLSCLYQ